MWALGDEAQRSDMEAAHAAAVKQAVAHLTETVPTVRRRYDGQVIEERATDLLAAEYRHTTARGVMEGDAPDPQLHSHVVITSAIREDGRLVAIASRPIFRAACSTPSPRAAERSPAQPSASAQSGAARPSAGSCAG